MKNKKNMIAFIIVIAIISFLLLGYFSFKMFLDFDAKVNDNYEKNLEKRNVLIQLVETYQLEYDENGLITNLDKVRLSGLADNDKIYVVYQEEELIVEFVYKSGFPDDGQSIFYSSGGEELLKDKLNESIYAYIENIEGNWYFVQYN